MNKLDLSGIKAAFIDFDDCAVIHHDHGNWDDWWRSCYEGKDDAYKIGERVFALPGLTNLLKDLHELGVNVDFLTWSNTSIIVIPKTKVLGKLYGLNMFDHVISVCSREYKIEFIKQFCNEYALAPQEVLVVDDHPETVGEALKEGYLVATPQEIVCRYARCVPDFQ